MRQAVKKSPVIFTTVMAVLLVAWWSIGFIPLGPPKLRVYFDQIFLSNYAFDSDSLEI